ncbi:MAG: hypothetical protein C0624_04705 [Desulfuromonas sp.]|nr:MAG: hypothetical protein C0624_04705 [Desulfuromonas sp.]
MRALLMVTLCLLATPVWGVTLQGEVRWKGELHFKETVRVEKGATLRVEPGSSIVFSRGGLEIAGRLVADDCRFRGQGWDGLKLKQADATTRLVNVTIRGARTGIFIGGGEPQLEGVTLKDNGIGIELKQKSRASIRNSRFENNNKVGLFIKDDSTPQIENCLFVANGRYGVYIHHSSPTTFTHNHFERNATGLAVSHYGATPVIEACTFDDNELGVLVDRAALPELIANRFENNRTGLKLYRRSDARVSGNRFAQNDLGLLVSFSSYPQISGNDFDANGIALRLEYQSAEWEKQRGAAARAQEVSRQGAFGGQKSSQVNEEQRRARDLDGLVNARGNWWGVAGTHELQTVEGACNPSFIDDGRDRPQFEEEGVSYPLDRVDFADWHEQSQYKGNR